MISRYPSNFIFINSSFNSKNTFTLLSFISPNLIIILLSISVSKNLSVSNTSNQINSLSQSNGIPLYFLLRKVFRLLVFSNPAFKYK